MELFARISCAFTAGDLNIENDDYINEALNNKFKSFVNSNANHRIQNSKC